MSSAVRRIELPGDVFGEDAACLGPQLEQLVKVLHLNDNSEQWYYADVETNGASSFSCAPGLHKVGNSEDFANLLVGTDQFQSGVFLVSRISSPRFRANPTTEDTHLVDLGDADVEIRAFDTTYFEVYSRDLDLLERLSNTYGVDLYEAPDDV